jgi:hypothetical protein
MWTQMGFDFGAGAPKPIAHREVIVIDFSPGTPERLDAPKKPKLLTCLRCGLDETKRREIKRTRRICNECKNPKGKPGRYAEYMDDVEEHSIAIRAKSTYW